MKQTINESQFIQAFTDYDRQDQFSYEGLKALYNFIDELDQDCDTETELDVIALCCEFTEYDSLEEFQDNYGADDYPDLEAIQDSTLLIMVDNDSFIIQDF